MNYCRIYPRLLVRQVDQFGELRRVYFKPIWPLAGLPGKSQSLFG